MQQRRLRLGDVLDDYCPRERRVTNHVVVAMIEDEVKQTRCSTCDADHEYKGARVPSVRRKKDAGVLSAEVAEDTSRVRRPPDAVESDELLDEAPDESPVADEALEAVDEAPVEGEAVLAPEEEDEGPVHRRLIRATFPRPEGQTPERREPDFTVRQPGRGGPRENDGNRPQGPKRHRRPPRPGGGRSGDARFSGSSPGNGPRGGGGQGDRGPHHGQPGGNQPGGNRPQGRPGGGEGRPAGGGEGRFRRRRGR